MSVHTDPSSKVLSIQFSQKKKVPQKAPRGECVGTKWAVVTTIFEPSKAIELAAKLEDWCVCIVADTKTPEAAYAALQRNKRVVYLSEARQRRWAAQGRFGRAFVAAVPWKHFSRKNVGYLHAIAQGARLIFDFDDDNELKTDSTGKPFDPMPPLDAAARGGGKAGKGLEFVAPDTARAAFNPYVSVSSFASFCCDRFCFC